MPWKVVDGCDCMACRVVRTAAGLNGPTWIENIEHDLLSAGVVGTETAGMIVLESFHKDLQAGIDDAITKNYHPCDRMVDAMEWVEWHLVPELRGDKDEPIPTWLGTKHP